MKEDKLEKFEWPSWKDLLAVAGLVLAGFLLAFLYYMLGAFKLFILLMVVFGVFFLIYTAPEVIK